MFLKTFQAVTLFTPDVIKKVASSTLKLDLDYAGFFKKSFQRHGVSLETAYFVGVCSH